MKFKSKISNSSIFGLSLFALFSIGLAIWFWFLNPDKILLNSFLSICFIIFAGFFLSAFDTHYKINSDELTLKSGIWNGKISIDSIQTIDVVNSIWKLKYIFILSANYSPALGNKGLLIKYEKFKEIYISPENSEAFVVELLNLNPEIKINRN